MRLSRSNWVAMQVYTNRKRAQTKAVNQARKEQEAAANADQHEPGQPQAGDSPPVASGGPSHAAPLTVAFAGQPPEGLSSLSPDAGASQPAFGRQQPSQQQYGATLPPPVGSSLYPAQHQHSNDAAAYMQMAPQTTAAYMAQPLQSGTLPQPAFYGAVPQAAAYGTTVQSLPHGSPLPGVSYQAQPQQYAQQTPQQQQQQQQQPQVLNVRPLPGQSMADAAMAAIQAQQVRRPMTDLAHQSHQQGKLLAFVLIKGTRNRCTALELLSTRHQFAGHVTTS